MEPLARSKNIALEIECADLPRIVGDPRWLERAILNLLDNAVKFTPESGRIWVQSSLHGEYAAIEVSDTGVGIPADAIPHIFERFYQVDGSRPNPAQGVGLGLAIAKWIVEAHKGTIQVQSTVGTGTRFTVLLPLAQSAAAAYG
jgi:two-component system phosphate regulon sensor histidine kinase PhoR